MSPGSGAPPRVPDDEPALAAALALAFAQLFAEVESGRRPRSAVERILVPHLAARLAPHWVRGGAPRRVVRAHGQLIGPGRWEGVVLLWDGRRTAALALRLERAGSKWRVTEVSRPEDGVLPEPVVWLPAREPCAFELVPVAAGGAMPALSALSDRTGPALAPVVGL